ncbi:rSAM/selenodomain-associated transferase 2 [Chromohalobacter marismortui]|uniref:RSAM/selenodomain-associated transferase 2 n=1 Tax=Chromohalobacter marismortui TaxID=42055 RepID=A0A4R7NP95_9GAMM|nr:MULTISPECIES: TIGR04283 family arsenosugar biosynthesis glycosyltransferase [Chromohalobacter]MCI0509571.1 TIGR04283 family arsenosugar biosynthesis glycosyltransferase [Chromohalobacter sp.]MCI0592535.1 TIGR04283 family arsenosugar biosynthesis glycosyltransferase [Chromohalobacter sp.]TDU22291.1 rSAM/selenodomain-associated transferase 2 [Chromohalobacter marismortui]
MAQESLTTPWLSVIVPVVNEAATIQVCLTALLPLRDRGVEIVVVDGGSDDDTVALARPLADRVLVSARGRARQMNHGGRESRGDGLVFVHADTRLPGCADRLIDTALKGPTCWGRFDVEIERGFALAGLVGWSMNRRSRLTGIATGDQAIFMARDAFERVGGFPDQPLMEDIEISRRLRRLSAPACLAQRVTTSARRWQQHGPLRTIVTMWWLRLRYWCGVSPWTLAGEYTDAR